MSEQKPQKPTNRLSQEASAYLRQHMHNPVDWYPWGREALDRAAAEDKPLLVSIGYSACHWCHVMERESFEDPATAAQMNEFFVCIKVDREERPDLDQIYMDAVMRMHGHGGWPLTAFCKPTGEPFFGGTYFPPVPRHGMAAFRQVLAAVSDAYANRRAEVEQAVGQMLRALDVPVSAGAREAPGAESVVRAARALLRGADRTHGGFGAAPKFPTPTYLDLLLAAADSLPPDEAKDAISHVAFSCREMARSGVYDHVGGGFHRYAVDAHWGVPHFEKMLYDQGQLLRTYAETWRRTGQCDAALIWPIRETVDFLRREMRAPDGGFYASLDADSEGEEGKFYAWKPDEIARALGEERATAFNAAYGVTAAGNFDGATTVLREVTADPRERFAEERETLRRVRSARIAPGTDRKRLAAWNSMLISGLARAGSLLQDDGMLEDAAATADFALEKLIDDDGRLLRTYDLGRARVPAFLDDVAGMLEACLDLQRAGADERFFAAALRYADDIATRFFDADAADLFLTPCDGEPLVVRPRSDHDGATPHSAGLAAMGLLRAGAIAGRSDLLEIADRVLRTHAVRLERSPEALPTLARAALAAERGISVAVVVGNPSDEATRALAARARAALRPEDAVLSVEAGKAPVGVDPAWISGRDRVDGRPTAYVCRGSECSLPAVSPDELATLC
ncbi:MAG: thioredoxin domain-containing protein [Deltaproteobacteria bacterium]|nr:thioredoxin domain-containing protein [Deltaproteobacteria bacterium]